MDRKTRRRMILEEAIVHDVNLVANLKEYINCLEVELTSYEWQTIDSAPKDGTEVMLFGLCAGEVNGVSEFRGIDIGSWSGGKSDWGDGDWWDSTGGDAYKCWCKATHWMPLPENPEDIPRWKRGAINLLESGS